jgi:hypothetical protein
MNVRLHKKDSNHTSRPRDNKPEFWEADLPFFRTPAVITPRAAFSEPPALSQYGLPGEMAADHSPVIRTFRPSAKTFHGLRFAQSAWLTQKE